eukprot:2490838-Prymnesium_polylepis.1
MSNDPHPNAQHPATTRTPATTQTTAAMTSTEPRPSESQRPTSSIRNDPRPSERAPPALHHERHGLPSSEPDIHLAHDAIHPDAHRMQPLNANQMPIEPRRPSTNTAEDPPPTRQEPPTAHQPCCESPASTHTILQPSARGSDTPTAVPPTTDTHHTSTCARAQPTQPRPPDHATIPDDADALTDATSQPATQAPHARAIALARNATSKHPLPLPSPVTIAPSQSLVATTSSRS